MSVVNNYKWKTKKFFPVPPAAHWIHSIVCNQKKNKKWKQKKNYEKNEQQTYAVRWSRVEYMKRMKDGAWIVGRRCARTERTQQAMSNNQKENYKLKAHIGPQKS